MIASAATTEHAPAAAGDGGFERVHAWTRTQLPALNLAIITGAASPGTLVHRLNDEVLPWLPAPATLSPAGARRLLVLAGLWGSSVVRHFAERGPVAVGGSPLHLLRSPARGGFADVVRVIAERTESGHPARDGYVSIVHWNAPPVEVHWRGTRLGGIGSAFGPGEPRTFTALRGEVEFVLLLKRAEAVEGVANRLLEPLWDSEVALDEPEWCRRALLAADMLRVVHALNCDFRERGALDAPTFIDVFRQFAVSWTGSDVPPSGAQDHEWLLRDLILGIDVPGYERHVRRQFPAMTDEQRAALEPAFGRTPLAELALHGCGVAPASLEAMSAAELARLVGEHPALAACFLVARAHGQIASSHLGLTKQLLFNPIRARGQAEATRRRAVPNDAGTTGMLEQGLEALTAARKRHPLRPLALLGTSRLRALAGFEPEIEIDKGGLHEIVRVGGMSP